MVSAWDVYWVMQLDSIGSAMLVIAILSGIGTGILAIVTFDGLGDPEPELVRWVKRAAGTCVAALLALAFIPSTKTAAAMVVLPAIANNQTLQREAGDLYGIAKQALRDAVKPDDAKAADPAK